MFKQRNESGHHIEIYSTFAILEKAIPLKRTNSISLLCGFSHIIPIIFSYEWAYYLSEHIIFLALYFRHHMFALIERMGDYQNEY